jgi:hypothetical protein
MTQYNLSYSRARDIQEEQIVYYSRGMSDLGRAELRREIMDKTILYHGDKEAPLSIFTINDMVPRGGWFERQNIINMRVIDRYHPAMRLDFTGGV